MGNGPPSIIVTGIFGNLGRRLLPMLSGFRVVGRKHVFRPAPRPIALDDAHRGETCRHRQAIATERRLMHIAAFERAHGPFIDLPPRDHRRHRHVAAAERLSDQHHVGLQAPMLESEPLARTPQPRLDLVDDEQRAIPPAQRLRGFQVTGGRKSHCTALNGLDNEGGYILGAQLCL